MKARFFIFMIVVFILTGCTSVPEMVMSTDFMQSAVYQTCDAQETKLVSIPGSCTTFAIQMGDRVLFGNNEDYENPLTYYWVVPSTEIGYGGIYLGYEYGRSQGGINEKGLAFDGLALDPEPLNPQAEKLYPGHSFTAFLSKVMRQSANVDQAIQMMFEYDFGETFAAQVVFADATGDAAIIGPGPDGELAVTRKPAGDGYLLGTNFNVVQLQDEDFEIPCWRYDKARQMLDKLQKKGDLSVDTVFNILDKVHQEGRRNNTLYSNVFDLKNGVVYLTYWYQYDEVITLYVQEEVDKRTNLDQPANTSDKVRLKTIFSERTVSGAEKAFQRYINALSNLEKIAFIWVVQMVICAVLTFIDLMHQPDIQWYVKCIWLLASFFLGVLGLLIYWVSFRRPRTQSLSISTFAGALGSTALSATGVTFAFLCISLVVALFSSNANLGIFAILIPFVTTLLMFRVPMMAFITQVKYWKTSLRYLLPEIVSTVVAVICIIFINQYMGDYFNQYSRYIGTPTDIFFWTQFTPYAVSGSIALYLLHLLLIHYNVNLWPVNILKTGDSAE